MDGGPGGAADVPITGLFYPVGPMNSGGLGPAVIAANRVYYWQFNLTHSITFTNYKSYANVGTGINGFAVMNSACTLIAGTTATASAPGANPFKATPASPVTLQAGTYFMAWTGDTTTDKLFGTYSDGYYGTVADAGDAATSSSFFYGSNASVSGVVPSTCGATRTAIQATVPIVGMR